MMRTDGAFGGYKQSGYGREFGKYSLTSYLETKTITTSFEHDKEKKTFHKFVHKTLA